MGFMSIAFLSIFMLVVMFVMFLLWVGTLVLEVFLSRMKQRWTGLILPGISFVISLIIVIGIAYEARSMFDFSMFCDLCQIFLLTNIGTAIYLLIYFFVRYRRRKKLNAASQTNTTGQKG